MMKKKRFIYYLLAVASIGFYACNKDNANFTPVGGELPTHYITIQDSGFDPATLTIANGGSVTFLNSTTVDHTLLSDDSVVIRSAAIVPGSFFFVKPDTSLGLLPVEINYHCVQHPSARGTIILTP
ncbi:MAG TPA: hypothetical protein PLC48_04970 [Ferruginibacter sp.]|nr:hypothetical protein [Ferruginibacter sp.]